MDPIRSPHTVEEELRQTILFRESLFVFIPVVQSEPFKLDLDTSLVNLRRQPLP